MKLCVLQRITGGIAAIVFLAAASQTPVPAGDRVRGGDDLEPIVAFLRDHVVGTTVFRENTAKLDAGRVEAVFQRALNFARVETGDDGFTLQVIASIQQTNYDLDEHGARRSDATGRKEDRVIVAEIRIGRSRSTGQAVGYMTFPAVTSSAGGLLKSAKAVQAELHEQSLVLRLTTVGYDDGYAQGGTFRCITVDDVWTIEMVDGKLQLTEKSTTYPFDPATGTKGPGEESQAVSRAR